MSFETNLDLMPGGRECSILLRHHLRPCLVCTSLGVFNVPLFSATPVQGGMRADGSRGPLIRESLELSEQLCLWLPRKRARQMFTAEQYRAKAAEFRTLLINTPRSPNETSEFRDLEQTYTTLAENEEWMVVNIDRTIRRRKYRDDHTAHAEEELILRCLGAAVIMQWNTVPTKLQRELFDCASTIGHLQQTTLLKGQIARFLHDHKDDEHLACVR